MLRAGLAFLLVLTLSIKLASGYTGMGFQVQAAADPELRVHGAAVATFLARNGFTIDEWQGDGELRMASAHLGSCRVLVGALSPLAWNRDLLHSLTAGDGRAFFVFEGQVYLDQPRLKTWSAYLWRRTRLFFGSTTPGEGLFGVVTLDSCRQISVPWEELSRAERSGKDSVSLT